MANNSVWIKIRIMFFYLLTDIYELLHIVHEYINYIETNIFVKIILKFVFHSSSPNPQDPNGIWVFIDFVHIPMGIFYESYCIESL